MRTFLLLLCGFQAFSALAHDPPAQEPLEAVFSELRALKPMRPGQRYTLRVARGEETGLNDHFLRRRTAEEIKGSGWSCGCGDHAISFIDGIERRGFKALLVDSAEISSQSLHNHFSGHAVVAIRPKEAIADVPWWLVDPTNLKILSRDWSPAEKSFQAFGCVFWIGYCGPLADYPVHSPQELKAFYTRTLASASRDFLNRTLYRFKFRVDPSLMGENGEFLNPRLAAFLQAQAGIFAAYDILPDREVSILLTRGGEGITSTLAHSESAGWVAHVGLQSGCSPSFLSYCEKTIRIHEQPKTK